MQLYIRRKAFTLVELLVVMTILSILIAVGFISYQTYGKNARDSSRVTTISELSKGIELAKLNQGRAPQPESQIGTGTMNGQILTYVGYIKDGISSMISLKEPPVDPLSKSYYLYGVDITKKKYQIATITENLQANTNIFVSSAFADAGYKAKVVGNYKGLLKYQGYIYNIPSLLTTNTGTFTLSGASVNFVIDSQENLPYLVGNAKTLNTYSPTQVLAKVTSSTGTLSVTGLIIPTTVEDFSTNSTAYKQLGYNLDIIGNEIFGTDYIAGSAGGPASTLTGITFNTDLYSLSDNDLKRLFTQDGTEGFINSYTKNWLANACNVSTMSVVHVTNSNYFANPLTLTGNTIYKLANGVYNLGGAAVSTGALSFSTGCVALIGQSRDNVIFSGSFTSGGYQTSPGIITINGQKNIIINNLKILGSSTHANRYAYGITAKNTNSDTYNNIYLSNSYMQFQASVAGNSNYQNLELVGGYYGIVFFSGGNNIYVDNVKAYNSQYGFVIDNSSNLNVTNLEAYNNAQAGLQLSNANLNKISNIKLYSNTTANLQLISSNNGNIFKNVDSYNSLNFGFMLIGDNNIFTNFKAYNNGQFGVYIWSSSKNNTFNNFVSFNNYRGGVFTRDTSNSNLFSTFVVNNNGPSSTTGYGGYSNVYNANYMQYFYNAFIANNYGTGLYLSGTTLPKYYGTLKIFGNNNNTNGLAQGTDGLFIGLPNGLVDTTGTMDCSWHVQPAGGNWGAGCSTKSNITLTTPVVSYTYGASIPVQKRPVRWNTSTNQFEYYGTDGVDYDSTKKIGQW